MPSDEERGHREDRGEHDEERGRDDDVERPLDERAHRAERLRAGLEQRQVAHDPEPQTPDHRLERGGPHEEVGPPSLRDLLRDPIAPRRALRGQDDLVDPLGLDDRGQPFERAEVRDLSGRRVRRVLRDDSDDLDAAPRVAPHRIHDPIRGRTRADDERAAVGQRKEPVEPGAPGGEEDPVGREISDENRTGEGVGRRQEINRGEREELEEEGRQEEARERLPESLVLRVEPHRRESEELHRDDRARRSRCRSGRSRGAAAPRCRGAGRASAAGRPRRARRARSPCLLRWRPGGTRSAIAGPTPAGLRRPTVFRPLARGPFPGGSPVAGEPGDHAGGEREVDHAEIIEPARPARGMRTDLAPTRRGVRRRRAAAAAAGRSAGTASAPASARSAAIGASQRAAFRETNASARRGRRRKFHSHASSPQDLTGPDPDPEAARGLRGHVRRAPPRARSHRRRTRPGGRRGRPEPPSGNRPAPRRREGATKSARRAA